jgi:hypothetical protein
VLSDTDALRDLIEAEAEIVRGEGESEEQLPKPCAGDDVRLREPTAGVTG